MTQGHTVTSYIFKALAPEGMTGSLDLSLWESLSLLPEHIHESRPVKEMPLGPFRELPLQDLFVLLFVFSCVFCGLC